MAEMAPASLLQRVIKGVVRRVSARSHAIVNRCRAWRSWMVIAFAGSLDRLRMKRYRRSFQAQYHSRFESTSQDPSVRRVAFVLPWFGADIGGGAEAEARGLIQALNRYEPDIQIEVLTTTLKEFAADWNTPFHPAGSKDEYGILVRRFDPSMPDRKHFHFLNGDYLMQNAGPCPDDPQTSPVPRAAEHYFLQRTIRSRPLLDYMRKHYNDYDAFVLIPYMFALTVEGCILAGPKAMLIPCLHDERYAYMHVYREAFSNIGAALCHVRSEAALFSRLYPDAPVPALIGEQVDVDVAAGDAERFRQKFGIEGPFVLYAGRQVEGKNLPLMVDYFTQFRESESDWSDLQFVLIGKGDLDYRGRPGVRSLGFVSTQDKVDAYRAANAFVMLSNNESFSIVIMEAWLQNTPVIVSSDCAVTADHVKDSGGGYAVGSAEAYKQALVALLSDPAANDRCGKQGREYVLANYTPKAVTARFREECDRLICKSAT